MGGALWGKPWQDVEGPPTEVKQNFQFQAWPGQARPGQATPSIWQILEGYSSIRFFLLLLTKLGRALGHYLHLLNPCQCSQGERDPTWKRSFGKHFEFFWFNNKEQNSMGSFKVRSDSMPHTCAAQEKEKQGDTKGKKQFCSRWPWFYNLNYKYNGPYFSITPRLPDVWWSGTSLCGPKIKAMEKVVKLTLDWT